MKTRKFAAFLSSLIFLFISQTAGMAYASAETEDSFTEADTEITISNNAESYADDEVTTSENDNNNTKNNAEVSVSDDEEPETEEHIPTMEELFEEYDETWAGHFTDEGSYLPAPMFAKASEATVNPGGTTFIDVHVKSAEQICFFMASLEYDRNALELISVSLGEKVTADPEKITAYKVPDSEHDIISLDNDHINVDFNGENTVRLGFRASENTADGEYPIVLDWIDRGVPVALRNDKNTNEDIYIPVAFISGKITVDSSSVPHTDLKYSPLSKKKYCSVNGAPSVISGDATNDGQIDAADLLMTKKYLLGSDDAVPFSDINEDGIVNITDFLIMKEYILG